MEPQRRKGASRVLSALDDALRGRGFADTAPDATISTPLPAPLTLARKRRSDEREHGQGSSPVKRKRAQDEALESPAASSPRKGILSTPKRAPATGEQQFDMERLFPNSFTESPKSKLAGDAQMRRENEKIGPPLSEALKTLGLTTSNDFFPGLEIKLMKHQIIGASWMLRQELDPTKRGGILADDMGLGKTIQMIALMVANQRDSDNVVSGRVSEDEDEEEPIKGKGKAKLHKRTMYGKTTLIVCPASLLHQWREEIETKCQEGLLRILIHHGKEKLKTVKASRQYDVILTSHQTLTAEFPTKLNTHDQSDWTPEMGGVLAKIKWSRVVLDEAQVVRNRLTQSAQCIFRLQTRHRWCLSGTPIFNGVADIFSYLRFCRPGYYDWDNFNHHICRVEKSDTAAATRRANEWLDPLMLRRTKLSKLDGKFILDELPPKTIEIVELNFSEGERRIYDDLEARVEETVANIISRGEENKYHLYILVLILRLRQVCGHPVLMLGLKDALEDSTKMPQKEKDKEIARAHRELGRQFVEDTKQKFGQRALRRDQTNPEEEEECCHGCREVFNGNAMVIACGHEACADCLDDLAKSELRHEKDLDNLDKDDTYLRPCPTCKQLIDPTKAYKSAGWALSEEELVFGGGGFKKLVATERKKTKHSFIESDSDSDMPDAGALMKRLGSDKDGKESEGSNSTTPSSREPDETRDVLSASANLERWRNSKTPSSKLVGLVDMLRVWQRDAVSANDKVIIYSQWTSMLDLVEELFEQHAIRSLRYDGKMGREERDEAIARFKKMGGPKIILISTKSGSVGLNLTCANRIVNLDLSWNMAAENQAYDRAHRIGQLKPVHIKRFIIKNTIEARILELQRDKQQMADAVMGEGDAPLQRVSASMTTRELTSLIAPAKKGKQKEKQKQKSLTHQIFAIQRATPDD